MCGLNCQFLTHEWNPFCVLTWSKVSALSLIVCVLSGSQQSWLILIERFNLTYTRNHLFRMTLSAFSTQGWWHWFINCAHDEMDFEYQHELIGRVLKSLSGICPLQKHPTFAFCWRYHLALYTLENYTNQASLATL